MLQLECYPRLPVATAAGEGVIGIACRACLEKCPGDVSEGATTIPTGENVGVHNAHQRFIPVYAYSMRKKPSSLCASFKAPPSRLLFAGHPTTKRPGID